MSSRLSSTSFVASMGRHHGGSMATITCTFVRTSFGEGYCHAEQSCGAVSHLRDGRRVVPTAFFVELWIICWLGVTLLPTSSFRSCRLNPRYAWNEFFRWDANSWSKLRHIQLICENTSS